VLWRIGRALHCFDTGEEAGGIRAVVLERCLAPCDQSQTTNTAQKRIKPMHHPPAVLLVGHLLLQFYSLVMRGFQSYHTYNPFPPLCSPAVLLVGHLLLQFNSLVMRGFQPYHTYNPFPPLCSPAVLLARDLLLEFTCEGSIEPHCESNVLLLVCRFCSTTRSTSPSSSPRWTATCWTCCGTSTGCALLGAYYTLFCLAAVVRCTSCGCSAEHEAWAWLAARSPAALVFCPL